MADELENKQTTTSATTSTNNTPSYVTDQQSIQGIKDMYNANLDSTKLGLQKSYEQSLSDAQYNKSQIAPQFQAQKNDVAANYERQRRSNNLQAQANGLNTGAGSQMQLAQSAQYQSSLASLGKAQANQEAEADRGMADLKTQYDLQIADAQAKNDYQLSAALLDEYNRQYNATKQNADLMASYGDFSGYLQLGGMYTQEVVDQMKNSWSLQNPLLAFNLGYITEDQYFKMTGSHTPGYSSGGGGAYYGGDGSGWGGSINNTGSDFIDTKAMDKIVNDINSVGTTSWQKQAYSTVLGSYNSGEINKAEMNYITNKLSSTITGKSKK